MKNNLKISAFTLVELSIVLVIIGLLTAGVVGGQSLIESSKKQKLISEMRSYSIAIKAFQLEYDALPGDMPNAQDYWGVKTDCRADFTKTNTCNGNGDGWVYTNSTNLSQEYLMAWNQLALANIIPGQYHGGINVGGDNSLLGDNMPKFSSYENVGAWVYGLPPTVSTIIYGKKQNLLWIAGDGTNGSNANGLIGGFLTPKDTQTIDKKIDDGLASTGIFMGAQQNGTTVPCVTGAAIPANVVSADYVLTTTEKVCRVFYVY